MAEDKSQLYLYKESDPQHHLYGEKLTGQIYINKSYGKIDLIKV